MRIDVLTILPNIFTGPLDEGMLRKARERGLAEFNVVDIRDFAGDKHRVTDDYVFGGGPGMVMKAEPLLAAIEHLKAGAPGRPRVVLMTPAGRVFDQALAWELAREEHLIFICGRYEGVDERVREAVVTDEISIGDYVLTGGELPALVVIDAVVRLIPGVLNQEGAAEEESFSTGLLEGPHYTRPREFRGMMVPGVLISGNHAAIARWRRKEALRRTWQRRPELLQSAVLSPGDRKLLEEIWSEEESALPSPAPGMESGGGEER